MGLPPADREAAEVGGQEILVEVVKEEPDRGVIRRAEGFSTQAQSPSAWRRARAKAPRSGHGPQSNICRSSPHLELDDAPTRTS